MAFQRRTKTSAHQKVADRRVYMEIFTDISVDDVIAFMAQSEAQRLYIMPRKGTVRDPQTPSDVLKGYLMDVED